MRTDKEEIEFLKQCVSYFNGTKRISLPTSAGCEFLTLNEVIRCEGDSNYTIFHLADKRKLVVSKTLGEYEQMFVSIR